MQWLDQWVSNAPYGGGHWNLAVGWDPATRSALMHDPNWEARLVRGGYVTTSLGSGKALRYCTRGDGPLFIPSLAV